MSSLLTLGHSSGEESRKAGKRKCAVLQVAHGGGTEVAESQLPGTSGLRGEGGFLQAGPIRRRERSPPPFQSPPETSLPPPSTQSPKGLP